MQSEPATRFLDASEQTAWNDFVATAPGGSPYANTDYLDILCGVTGDRYRVLVAEQGGEIVGGITLYERATRWGTVVETRRLLQYNGFILRPPKSGYPSVVTSQDIRILTALCEEIRAADYAFCELKSRSPLSDGRVFGQFGWQVSPTYTYAVPLDDLDRQWGRVERNLRRLVKRAEGEGLTVTDDDDFDSFFRLHLEIHRRKGAPVYLPESAFRRYFEQLKARGLCRLFHARQPDGRSIAAQLVLLGAHPVTHTAAAAADGAMQKLGANPFLRWRVFEILAAEGYTANDLTDASLNPVTRFKSQLGGELQLCLSATTPRTRRARAGQAVDGVARRVLGPLRKVLRS